MVKTSVPSFIQIYARQTKQTLNSPKPWYCWAEKASTIWFQNGINNNNDISSHMLIDNCHRCHFLVTEAFQPERKVCQGETPQKHNELVHTCQVSRLRRETPAFWPHFPPPFISRAWAPKSPDFLQISRFSPAFVMYSKKDNSPSGKILKVRVIFPVLSVIRNTSWVIPIRMEKSVTICLHLVVFAYYNYSIAWCFE